MTNNDLDRRVQPELRLDEAPVPFIFLLVIFGGAYAAALAVASKLISIWGVTPSATVFAYSITFICTDCISELYGRKIANRVVLAGFTSYLIVTLLVMVAVYFPAADFWPNQESFETVFGTTWRITLASLLAYIVSQFHDVWAFHFWKKKTGGRHLWLRNNLSTISSQLIDTVIFISIAFLGVFPILPVIIGHFLIKLLIAAVDTPIVYAVVFLTRRKHGK